MYTIYGIKNCNTMKKAFDLLSELGIAYTFHDYKKSGIDVETLQKWVDLVGVDVLINRKGTTWRGLSAEEQQQAETLSGALELMQQKTSVIKRPVLTDGQKHIIVGLQEDQYQQLA